jgi:hypothetical protein
MKFGEKVDKRDVVVPTSDTGKEVRYPSVRISKNNPAYKSLKSAKKGSKLTLSVTFNVAATGDSMSDDDYGTFVELEMISAKKPRSENPDNEMSV